MLGKLGSVGGWDFQCTIDCVDLFFFPFSGQNPVSLAQERLRCRVTRVTPLAGDAKEGPR